MIISKYIKFVAMNRKLFPPIFLFLLTFNSGVLFAQSSEALNVFLKKESLAHAAISLKAIDLTTGKVVVSHNENMSATPASTLKIVTTATALDVLGKGFYYKTSLTYDGVIKDSVLVGNLYINGVGDPTLGTEFLEGGKEDFLRNWRLSIARVGIKSVSGDIVVMDQLFGYQGISQKWLWEDIGNYYAPGIYGISVFDNMYRVYVQSFAPGTKSKVLYTEPSMDELKFTNDLETVQFTGDDSYISGIPFSNDRRLYGQIPANRASFVVKGDIPDPGLYLAQYLYSYLADYGIPVKGKATTYRLSGKSPLTQKEIGTVYSHDLASIARVINVRSNNHYAEHIYKKLTIIDSINISAYWKEKGLEPNALFMFDGSGVSPANALSAAFLTDILVYMDKKEGSSGAFYQSLPVAGQEGTVASFLKNTPLAGKCRLKSGSITNVQAYAGYVEKGNKRYAIAVLVNNFTGKRADLRKDLEQLLLGIF